jgi:GNAT superfamily N-acetyltransferase
MPGPSGESPGLITIASEAGGPVAAEIEARLAADIAARFGPAGTAPIVFSARRDGMLAGGLTGVIHWRWLYVRQLWVDAGERGRGTGSALVRQAVAEARERGCAGLYVDTFDLRTVAFYERAGFRVAGAIPGFPPGHVRTFLALPLSVDDPES